MQQELRTVLSPVGRVLILLAFGPPVPVLILLHGEVGLTTESGERYESASSGERPVGVSCVYMDKRAGVITGGDDADGWYGDKMQRHPNTRGSSTRSVGQSVG